MESIPTLGLRYHVIADWDIILIICPKRLCRQKGGTISDKRNKTKKVAVFYEITLDTHMFYAILYVDIRSGI